MGAILRRNANSELVDLAPVDRCTLTANAPVMCDRAGHAGLAKMPYCVSQDDGKVLYRWMFHAKSWNGKGSVYPPVQNWRNFKPYTVPVRV